MAVEYGLPFQEGRDQWRRFESGTGWISPARGAVACSPRLVFFLSLVVE